MSNVARFVVFLLTASFAFRCARSQPQDGNRPIDRRALVARHNVVHRSAAAEHFLQVGNGEFAFAFDVTGLQTLDREFEPATPLHTMSNWGWHERPNAGAHRYEETLSEYRVGTRAVSYADKQSTAAGAYFRANPHRVNLARISLWWKGQEPDGRADPAAFSRVEQTLDLWSGAATSRFHFRGEPVTVTTVGHPQRDSVAFRIESPLVKRGELGAALRFSYPLGEWGPDVDDFQHPERHSTTLQQAGEDCVTIGRGVDDLVYDVYCRVGDHAKLAKLGEHAWRISWPNSEAGELIAEFTSCSRPDRTDRPAGEPLSFDAVRTASAASWERFWRNGGAIDLSAVDDPRAQELERRIVLSQYLAAIHNGSLPPQETGLVCNSWFGKQHLEMHWWHAAHFALWGRENQLRRSLSWYEKILPQARAIAARQGYRGVRWPKMTGPEGISSPSGVGEFLVWQQPHVIALLELIHRADPSPEFLKRYAGLVDESAEFMADYAQRDPEGAYRLGPPLIPAQECYLPRTTTDPTFELAYWQYALEIAQQWRARRGLARESRWDEVRRNLISPVVREGRYAATGAEPYTIARDHPSMLAAYGVLPRTAGIDPAIMRQTAAWVADNWDWSSTWGWDYPMMAMTWARCGEPERAVDALLLSSPKNRYLPNGHNYQEPRLPVYLPGNGGLLYAAAFMAAGWEEGPQGRAAGFPPAWDVRFERLRQAP